MESNKEELIKLEKQKVKEILDFVRINQLSKGTKDYEYFKKLISDLFIIDISLYKKNQDSVKLIFINDPDVTMLGNFKDESNYDVFLDKIVNDGSYEVKLNESNECFSKLDSSDVNLRVYACSELIRILFHEIRHYRQMQIVYSSESSDKALKYAKEYILINSINIRDRYRKNHDKYLSENDSELFSKNKISRYIPGIKKDNLDHIASYLFETIEIEDKYFAKMKEVPREDYVNYFVDALLNRQKGNLYYLKRYPILQKEYNMDGSKKSLTELVNNYYNELLECNDKIKTINIKRMYFDIIYRRLIPLRKEQEISLEEIELLSKDERFITLLSEMKQEFLRIKKINLALLDKIYIKKCKCDSNLNYINRNNKTVKYYIKDTAFIYKVSEFIKLFNLDFIRNNGNLSDEEKSLSEQFLYNYFFTRLPKSGYFILKDKTKINILDFYEKYIIPNINKLCYLDLNGYIEFLKEIVISECECENIINKEITNKFYQRKINVIDNFKAKLISNKEKEK
ncbi:MAG: hypothetical protein ACI33S_05015 [Bacilli bacterium]